jgi:hypothetical protein
MIYAQLHSYTDKDGAVQTTIAARPDQPDATWLPFAVNSTKELKIVSGAIAQLTATELSAAQSAASQQATNNAAKAELTALDGKSIRDIRAFLVAKFGNDLLLPPTLTTAESTAITERGKIR